MRKIWEQMSCAEYEARRALRNARLKRQPTLAQKDANYVVNCLHRGKEPDLDGRKARRLATQEKREREREAFRTLRKLGYA